MAAAAQLTFDTTPPAWTVQSATRLAQGVEVAYSVNEPADLVSGQAMVGGVAASVIFNPGRVTIIAPDPAQSISLSMRLTDDVGNSQRLTFPIVPGSPAPASKPTSPVTSSNTKSPQVRSESTEEVRLRSTSERASNLHSAQETPGHLRSEGN